jgi:peptide/nickel transport system substrate-binding protein
MSRFLVRTALRPALLAVALLTALLLGTATAQQDGGVLRVALPAQPETYNPVLLGELSSSIVYNALFAPLVAQDPETFDLDPYLADSWEANDAVDAWTFHLNRDATWHDGTDISADDVVFTFERILDESENSPGRADVAHIERIEAVDEHTVTFHLAEVDGMFPDRLSLGGLQPLPKHVLEGFDSLSDAVEFNTEMPVGSGPFKMKGAETGSYVELERFEDFFLGRPHLDGVIFSIVADMNVRVARLRAGDIDWTDIEPTHAEALQADPNVDVIPVSSSRYALLDFAFEGDYAWLFEDPRVRIAMAHAVPQQQILDTVGLGRGWLMNGRTIPEVLSWIPDPGFEPRAYDMERAQELLAEAGWTPGPDGILTNEDGERFEFYILVDRGNVQREQIGLILQDQFEQLGMDVEYVAAERTGRWIEETRARSFATRMAEFPIPNVDWFRRIYTTDGPNIRGYSNPELDALVDRATKISDRAEQGRLYAEAQRLHFEDPSVIPFFLREQLVAARADVRDLPAGELKLTTPYLHLVWLDR